jgi:glutathione S-transferase
MHIDRLKLFHSPASRSTRVKWMLHEVVGNEFLVEKVALYDAEQYAPEFLHMNPNHCVPVLQIRWPDGVEQFMLESTAIVAFLADAYPKSGLAPAALASRERADYMQMLHFGGTTMDAILWQIRIHEHVLPVAERDPRTNARYRHKFATEIEPQLLRRLTSAPYICGESFTAADCIVGHSVSWARGYGFCQDSVFRGYLSRLLKRPAYQAALADVREFTAEVSADKALVSRFTG